MPTVRFADPIYSNDLTEGGATTHSVLLSEGSSVPVTVTFSSTLSDIASGQSITFQPGQTQATVTYSAGEDTAYEGDEFYVFSISSVSGGGAVIDQTNSGEFARIAGYVRDNDLPPGPTVRFADPIYSNDLTEGAATTHRLVLSQAAATPVTVTFSSTLSDVAGGQSITFQPGQTEATVTYSAGEDTTYEGDEFYVFSISSVSGGGAVIDQSNSGEFARIAGYVRDNDLPPGPTVRFADPIYSNDLTEGAANTHRVLLSKAATAPVTVTFSSTLSDIAGGQSITFQPGQTEATVTYSAGEDTTYEGDEFYVFSISSVSGGGAVIDQTNSGEAARIAGYVRDNDAPGPVSTTPGQVMTASGPSATLLGGANNDTVTGLSGSNYLRGNDGDDRIQGGSGFDDTHGNAGNDTVMGGDGDDWVVGGKDNDLLFGEAGADIVYGNLGYDTLNGGDGADIVRGGQADDVLYGGAGDDFMSGDRGSDTVSGGLGADIFNFFSGAGLDQITDFNGLEGDRIRYEGSALSYSLVSVGGDTRIDFGGGDQLVLPGVSNFRADWIVLTGV